jgi:hypothetical protein
MRRSWSSCNLPGKSKENHEKSPDLIADIPAEFRIGHLLNTDVDGLYTLHVGLSFYRNQCAGVTCGVKSSFVFCRLEKAVKGN